MKLLLLLCTVCSIQHFGLSDVAPDRKELFSHQPVRGPLQSNVKILNERKLQKKVVSKQLFYEKAVHTGKTKRQDLKHKDYTVFPQKKPDLSNQGYTVFPPAPQNQRGIPESKYFPLFQEEEPNKPSVKKVLSPLRVKRSADKKRGLHSKKESKRDVENSRPDHVKDVDTRRSHHKRSHKKHKKHGKKHHRSRKHKKSGHRRDSGGKVPDPVKSGGTRSNINRDTRSRNDTRRMFGSRDATIEQFPYVVSIQKGDQHWCSGALLNPRIVITTANCVWRSVYASKMMVRAGSRSTTSRGQRAHILQVLKHPKWSVRKPPQNDVAVLLLDRNIRFSNGVHGVDIPNRNMIPAFDDVWVTSWGSDRRDGFFDPYRDQLQVYHAHLMDLDKCNNVTRRFGVEVTKDFFCLSQAGQRGPCTRDTGAPAVSDGVLWGVASWGLRKLCGTERYPAMFSYLGSPTNQDFLINATRILMSDMRDNPFLDHFPPRCGTERYPAMFSYLGSPTNQDFLINATRILMSDMRDNPFLDHFPPRCGTARYPAMFSYLGSPTNQDFLINATRILMSDMRDNPFLDHFPPRRPQVPTTTKPSI